MFQTLQSVIREAIGYIRLLTARQGAIRAQRAATAVQVIRVRERLAHRQ